MTRKRRFCPGAAVLALAAVCAGAWAYPARAQNQPGAGDSQDMPSVSDVIKQARKKETKAPVPNPSSVGARTQPVTPLTQDSGLRQYLNSLIEERTTEARRRAPPPPDYAGLPGTISETLPQDGGFVAFQKIPGDDLVADVNGRMTGFGDSVIAPGIKLPQAVEEQEMARLPDNERIRREIKTLRYRGREYRYEVWRYPAGTRLIHVIRDRATHRLIELRMMKKLPDEAGGGDGAWGTGIYRPSGSGTTLRLYKPVNAAAQESLEFQLMGGGKFRWIELSPDSCRQCHASMGDGWYQYRDEDHAGPCGFVPANDSLLGDWAARYQKRYGYFPFVGP